MDIVIVQAMSLSLLVLMSMEHTGRVASKDPIQRYSTLPLTMQDIVPMELTTATHRAHIAGSIVIPDSHSYRVTIARSPMYDVSKNNRVNTFSPDLFGSFFIFGHVYGSVAIYYYFPPMADIDTPQDAEKKLITPPDEILELTAGEEHLMLASLPEEKLLNSGEATVTLSQPTIVEAIASGTPIVVIPSVTPTTPVDLFADLPVSPVEKVVASTTPEVSIPTVIAMPTPAVIEPIASPQISNPPSATGYVDDCPSTAFYEKEHGVHTASSAHIGMFVAI
jgi:hypothetical protein